MQKKFQQLLFIAFTFFSINFSYATKTKGFNFTYGVGITNVGYTYYGNHDGKSLSTVITESTTLTNVSVTADLPNDKSIANSFKNKFSNKSTYMIGLSTTDSEPKKMDWWIEGTLTINGYLIATDFTIGLDDNKKNFWLGSESGTSYHFGGSSQGMDVKDTLGNTYCLKQADWYSVNVNLGPCSNLAVSQAEEFIFFYGIGIRDVSFDYSGVYANSYLGSAPVEKKANSQTSVSLIAKMDNSESIAASYNQSLNYNPYFMLNLANTALVTPATLDFWIKGSLKINGKEVAPDLILGSITNDWWVGTASGNNSGEWSGLSVHDADGVYYCLKSQAGRYNVVHVVADKCNNFISISTKLIGAKDGTSIANAIIAESNGYLYVVGSTTKALSKQPETGSQDYFVAKHQKDGKLIWLTQTGSANQISKAKAVTKDVNNNLYVVGYTTGGLYGQQQFGAKDYFLHKYSESGIRWPIQVGASGGDSRANGVATDKNGYVYVVGYTNVSLFGQPQQGTQDLFIHEYTQTGGITWPVQVGGKGGITRGYGIASSGNSIYVVGSTTVGLFGQAQNASTDAFITRYKQGGVSLIWSKQFAIPGYSETYASSVSADISGNTYIAGYALTMSEYASKQNYFVAKFDSNGNLKWTQTGVGSDITAATAVKVDPFGNVYVAGYTNSGLFGQKQNGNNDYFIARYDQFGLLHSINQVGNNDSDGVTTTNGLGVAIDDNGLAYIVGTTNASIAKQILTGTFDYFIASYVN